jgi:hypothetical protein
MACFRIAIHALANAIWHVISDFGVASQCFAGVVHWAAEGKGVSALRTLTSADGSTIVERLETQHEAAHRLIYIDPIRVANDGRDAKGTVYGQIRMTRASSTIAIHAPADAIWRVISDFGAACQYLDQVVDCTVEGEGVGALRTLTNADGTYAIVERLERLDEAARRLSYALWQLPDHRNPA